MNKKKSQNASLGLTSTVKMQTANVSNITLVTTVTNPVIVTTPAEHLCLQITVNYIELPHLNKSVTM